MADRRSSLAAVYRPEFVGSIADPGPGVRLCERRGLSLVQVAAFPEVISGLSGRLRDAFDLATLPAPGKSITVDRLTLLWQGPERWLAVEPGNRQGLDQALRDALADIPAVAVTDLSHARCVLRVTGPQARRLLAKGCSLDLHPESFRDGDCALTRFSHQSITVHACAASTFDIYVLRSFAQSLWEELIDLSGEFGAEVAEPLNG